MIIITTIYTTIYTTITTIVYKKKKEESKEERRNIEAFLRPIFSFFLIIIMKYNRELQAEIDAELEMQLKQSLECVVPDCHYCSPQFISVRPRRNLALVSFFEYIKIHGSP